MFTSNNKNVFSSTKTVARVLVMLSILDAVSVSRNNLHRMSQKGINRRKNINASLIREVKGK